MNAFLKYLSLAGIFLFFSRASIAQSLYFPPLSDTAWESISPESLGWETDSIAPLMTLLQEKNTKAFIVLKNGRIALEQYFGTFTRDSLWYWASAGKSMTAFLIGIAQQDGIISLQDSASHYLGAGWTSCPEEKEGKITLLHQITMTTGLQDAIPDRSCTSPDCLIYLADAGTRWAYHTAPYTLLDQVIETASGQGFNIYFNDKIMSRIGMDGWWFKLGDDNVYISKARSMARFGLLALNHGVWNSDTLLADTSYFRAMTNSSQNMNPSYGYLWWLNGKSSYKLPGLQFNFSGSWAPDAPEDMIAALGKNGQFINVVPSQKLVFIRMGESPDSSYEVPAEFNNDIWKKLNAVMTPQTSVEDALAPHAYTLEQNYPNPFNPATSITYSIASNPSAGREAGGFITLKIFDLLGREVAVLVNAFQPSGSYTVQWDGKNMDGKFAGSGVYFYRIQSGAGFRETKKMLLMK